MNKRLIWHKKEVEDVVSLLVDTRKPEEVELLFDRVLTTREINDIARRYKVLKMLDAGRSYTDIIVETGMSSSAIGRLSAKCGFGFQKSSGLQKPKKTTPSKRTKKLKYKGVTIRR